VPHRDSQTNRIGPFEGNRCLGLTNRSQRKENWGKMDGEAACPEKKRARMITGATREASVDAMLDDFPDFQRQSSSFADGKLLCKVCRTTINANPSRLKEHVESAKHKRIVQTTQKIEFALGKKSADSARNEAITCLVGNLAGLNVGCATMSRVMCPENVALMKHVGSFPGRTAVRDTYLPRAYEECLKSIRDFVRGQPFSVLVDESEDVNHKPIYCILIQTADACVLGDVVIPPPGVPLGGRNDGEGREGLSIALEPQDG